MLDRVSHQAHDRLIGTHEIVEGTRRAHGTSAQNGQHAHRLDDEDRADGRRGATEAAAVTEPGFGDVTVEVIGAAGP